MFKSLISYLYQSFVVLKEKKLNEFDKFFSYIILLSKSFFSSCSSSVRLLASIACGGLIYLAALLLTGAILKSDLEMLPNNEKIAKTLEKLGLIG